MSPTSRKCDDFVTMRRNRRFRAAKNEFSEFELQLNDARFGHPEAIGWLYSEYVGMVRGYFRACLTAEYDDLTSDVFVGMIRSLDRFRGDERMFRSWLMSIAHRRRVDHLRRSRVRLVDVTAGDELEAALDPTPPASDVGWIADPRIVDGLSTLTDEQREILAMRYVADMSIAEVAQATDRSAGAVKSLQNRAISSLRRVVPDLRERETVRR